LRLETERGIISNGVNNNDSHFKKGGRLMSKLEADVIVVAAGPAGLAAAISVARAGAKAIAFEKGSTTGGAGNMGMGPLAVESRLQKLKQMGPSRDEAFKIFMDYTHWRVDTQLVRAYIDKSATTIDWLEKLGVEFANSEGGLFTFRGALGEGKSLIMGSILGMRFLFRRAGADMGRIGGAQEIGKLRGVGFKTT
jgi:succinate dehydrogenase/fumarate reductase flavoprotein subunit